MNLKLNLIVAASENMGIGLNGDLPWRLRKELAHFSRLTKRTTDPGKQNAVIMGRRTWESIPPKNRPLPGRVNIVLSRQDLNLGDGVKVCSSLDGALQKLSESSLRDIIENVWIIGGSSVYKEALVSPHCHRVYLTKIQKKFDCDVFLPEIPIKMFTTTTDPDVSQEVQEEDGIKYTYHVYQRTPESC